MKNILVPVDFSDTAKNALKFAIKIAHATQSAIHLFYVQQLVLINSEAGAFVYPDLTDMQNAVHIEEQMNEWMDFVRSRNVEVHRIIRRGVLSDEIGDTAGEIKADLIISGTDGAQGLNAFLFGSNSAKIMGEVKCPVLIIPADAHYHGIHKILYATDFQFGDLKEIDKIQALAQLFSAQIIVAHVTTDLNKVGEDQDTMDWFEEMAADRVKYEKVTYRMLYHEDVVEGLNQIIKELEIDMVCMSTVEKSFLQKIFSKSNTKAMAFHTTIPFMALHLEENNVIS